MGINPDGKTRRGGIPYTSPLENDTSFELLSVTDKHYVHLYGSQIRDLIRKTHKPDAYARVSTISELIDERGGLKSQYREERLGKHTVRLATHATLRWMVHREELHKNSSRNGRRVLADRKPNPLDPVLEFHGYREVESHEQG